MFKSILRFVKSAHFFAFAFACIFGVFFATTNSWAVYCSQYSGHTCPSGKYWHVINNQCQTCPNDGRSDCSDGVFKCPRNGNTTYYPTIYVSDKNDPNNNEYRCNIFSSSGGTYDYSTCGEGKSYKECVQYRYLTDRTGCSVTTPEGTFNNRVMKQGTLSQGASGQNFDPCTGTTFYGTNYSPTFEDDYTYNAMPGYYKSSNGTCTQCPAGTFGAGTSSIRTSCSDCPLILSVRDYDTQSYSIATSPVGSTSASDCYYVSDASDTDTDGTGTFYYTGQCNFSGTYPAGGQYYGFMPCIVDSPGGTCDAGDIADFCKEVLGSGTSNGSHTICGQGLYYSLYAGSVSNCMNNNTNNMQLVIDNLSGFTREFFESSSAIVDFLDSLKTYGCAVAAHNGLYLD